MTAKNKNKQSGTEEANAEAWLIPIGLWLMKRFGPRLLKRTLKLSGGWAVLILALFSLFERRRSRTRTP